MLPVAFVVAARSVPVDDARDWLDYVAVWSGLVGALLAAFAVGYAAWQARETKRALIRERRMEFELEFLAELRRQLSVTGFSHLAGYVGTLIIDASDETDIPMLRAIVGVKSGPIGAKLRDDLSADAKSRSADINGTWTQAAELEIDRAIQRRLVG